MDCRTYGHMVDDLFGNSGILGKCLQSAGVQVVLLVDFGETWLWWFLLHRSSFLSRETRRGSHGTLLLSNAFSMIERQKRTLMEEEMIAV
jgi:hypothetical protein